MKKMKLRVLSGFLAFMMLFFGIADYSVIANAANNDSVSSIVADDNDVLSFTASGNGTASENKTDDKKPVDDKEDEAVVYYEYTVSFNGGEGATGAMEAQKFDVRVAQTLSANAFVKEGYSFQGWKDAAGNVYADEQAFGGAEGNLVNPTKADEVVNLTAVWEKSPIAYYLVKGDKVEYVANPSEYGLKTDVELGAKKVKLTANKSLKKMTGYAFGGFYTDKNCKTKKITKIAKLEKATAIYVKLTPWTYTVKFNKSGAKGKMAAQKFTYTVSGNLAANTLSKNGYEFLGWSTAKKNGSVEYADQATVNFEIKKNKQKVNLYPVFKANTYKITFVTPVGTVSVSENTYEVGTKISNKALKEMSTVNGLKADEGQKFVGWFKTSNGKKKASISKKTYGDQVFYAKVVSKYTVSFNGTAVGATGSMDSVSYQYTKAKKLPKNKFTKEGQKFLGWAVSCNSVSDNSVSGNSVSGNFTTANIVFKNGQKISYVDKSLLTYTENGPVLTLVPVFSNTCNINYIVDGKVVATEPYTVGAKANKKILKNATKPVKDGYKFAGWYASSDLKKKAKITNKTVGDINVYAKFKGDKKAGYVITFDNNEASLSVNATVKGKMKSMKGVYGKAKSITKNKFKASGYEFKGWSLSANGTVEFANGEKITFDTVSENGVSENAIAKNVTLYAVWAPVSYDVVVVDTTFGTSYVRSYTIETPIETVADLKLPIRKGYTVDAVYKNIKCKKEVNFAKTFNFKSNKKAKVVFVKSTPAK